MSTKQKTGPREKQCRNPRTTTKGSRGKRSSIFKHGLGKSVVKSNNKKKIR